MPLEPEIVVGVGLPVIGGVVWLVRMEGRVNGLDKTQSEHREEHKDIKEDLRYIRERLDELAKRGR